MIISELKGFAKDQPADIVTFQESFRKIDFKRCNLLKVGYLFWSQFKIHRTQKIMKLIQAAGA